MRKIVKFSRMGENWGKNGAQGDFLIVLTFDKCLFYCNCTNGLRIELFFPRVPESRFYGSMQFSCMWSKISKKCFKSLTTFSSAEEWNRGHEIPISIEPVHLFLMIFETLFELLIISVDWNIGTWNSIIGGANAQKISYPTKES